MTQDDDFEARSGDDKEGLRDSRQTSVIAMANPEELEFFNKCQSPTGTDILDLLEPPERGSSCLLHVGRKWRGDPLSNTGKRQQILQILSLTLFPILGLWAFNVYSVGDSIKGKRAMEQTQNAVRFSVELGLFLDRIQRERDMSVLYLSILGPETKTFLMNEYLLTDEALNQLSGWPVKAGFASYFKSKKAFRAHLNAHRNNLDPSNFDIYVTMNFYNMLIERFVVWMYGAITESSMASIWKVLVAYQKIVTVMEHLGIERALGTVFYVDGGLSQSLYERYISRVNIFKANYRSAVLYSDIIDPIFQEGVTSDGTNLTVIIERFRFEIQHAIFVEASITKGQWWFDNMTIYLDRLLFIQQELAIFINGELQYIIDTEEKNLTVSVCCLAVVILMCPLVIFSVDALVSGIQLYAMAMVQRTKELFKEKKRAESLLYLMVPGPIALKLKRSRPVEAEYYKSVTVMSCDINEFGKIFKSGTPTEFIDLLNEVSNSFEDVRSRYDAFSVKTVNDSYLVASGFPTRESQHPVVIAKMASDLVERFGSNEFVCGSTTLKIPLRIGIHTGPVVAGTVGSKVFRYCLLGHTVIIAERLKAHCLPYHIHVTETTRRLLRKERDFLMGYWSTMKYVEEDKIETNYKIYWLKDRNRSVVDQSQRSSTYDEKCSVDTEDVSIDNSRAAVAGMHDIAEEDMYIYSSHAHSGDSAPAAVTDTILPAAGATAQARSGKEHKQPSVSGHQLCGFVV